MTGKQIWSIAEANPFAQLTPVLEASPTDWILLIEDAREWLICEVDGAKPLTDRLPTVGQILITLSITGPDGGIPLEPGFAEPILIPFISDAEVDAFLIKRFRHIPPGLHELLSDEKTLLEMRLKSAVASRYPDDYRHHLNADQLLSRKLKQPWIFAGSMAVSPHISDALQICYKIVRERNLIACTILDYLTITSFQSLPVDFYFNLSGLRHLDTEEVDAAMGLIHDLGFTTLRRCSTGPRFIDVHPTVGKWLFLRLAKCGHPHTDQILADIIQVFANYITFDDAESTSGKMSFYLPLISKLLIQGQAFEVEGSDMIILLHKTAMWFKFTNLPELAQPLLLRARAMAHKCSIGFGHALMRETEAEIRVALGDKYGARKSVEAALYIISQLNLQKQEYATSTYERLEDLYCRILLDLGLHRIAEEKIRKQIDKVAPEDRDGVLYVERLYRMVRCMIGVGKDPLALKYSHAVMSWARRHNELEVADTGLWQANHGILLFKRGKPRGALPILKRAVRLLRQKLGTNDAITWSVSKYIYNCYADIGADEEKEKFIINMLQVTNTDSLKAVALAEFLHLLIRHAEAILPKGRVIEAEGIMRYVLDFQEDKSEVLASAATRAVYSNNVRSLLSIILQQGRVKDFYEQKAKAVDEGYIEAADYDEEAKERIIRSIKAEYDLYARIYEAEQEGKYASDDFQRNYIGPRSTFLKHWVVIKMYGEPEERLAEDRDFISDINLYGEREASRSKILNLLGIIYWAGAFFWAGRPEGHQMRINEHPPIHNFRFCGCRRRCNREIDDSDSVFHHMRRSLAKEAEEKETRKKWLQSTITNWCRKTKTSELVPMPTLSISVLSHPETSVQQTRGPSLLKTRYLASPMSMFNMPSRTYLGRAHLEVVDAFYDHFLDCIDPAPAGDDHWDSEPYIVEKSLEVPEIVIDIAREPYVDIVWRGRSRSRSSSLARSESVVRRSRSRSRSSSSVISVYDIGGRTWTRQRRITHYFHKNSPHRHAAPRSPILERLDEDEVDGEDTIEIAGTLKTIKRKARSRRRSGSRGRSRSPASDRAEWEVAMPVTVPLGSVKLYMRRKNKGKIEDKNTLKNRVAEEIIASASASASTSLPEDEEKQDQRQGQANSLEEAPKSPQVLVRTSSALPQHAPHAPRSLPHNNAQREVSMIYEPD